MKCVICKNTEIAFLFKSIIQAMERHDLFDLIQGSYDLTKEKGLKNHTSSSIYKIDYPSAQLYLLT